MFLFIIKSTMSTQNKLDFKNQLMYKLTRFFPFKLFDFNFNVNVNLTKQIIINNTHTNQIIEVPKPIVKQVVKESRDKPDIEESKPIVKQVVKESRETHNYSNYNTRVAGGSRPSPKTPPSKNRFRHHQNKKKSSRHRRK